MNTINPGNTALLAEIAGRGDQQWVVDRKRWGVADQQFVSFAPSFFSPERLAHVFNLAASTLGNVFLAYGDAAYPMVADEQIAQALPSLAAWAEKQASWHMAEAIQKLLSNMAPGIPYWTMGDAFELDLPPVSDKERALWVLEATIAQPMRSAFLELSE